MCCRRSRRATADPDVPRSRHPSFDYSLELQVIMKETLEVYTGRMLCFKLGGSFAHGNMWQ